jgi:hypothetical protein
MGVVALSALDAVFGACLCTLQDHGESHNVWARWYQLAEFFIAIIQTADNCTYPLCLSGKLPNGRGRCER